METQLEKAGKKIGNYLIGKSLGQGTFGKVKLGVQIQTQEKVMRSNNTLGSSENFEKV